MPSGDSKPIKVPVAKNMLDSHLNGSLFEKGKSMLTIIIAEAEVCFCDNANRKAKCKIHQHQMTQRVVFNRGRGN